MIKYKQILKNKGIFEGEGSNAISALKEAVLQAVPIVIQEISDSCKGKVEVDYESILRKLSITEEENKTLNKDLFGKVVQPTTRILFKAATP